MKKIYLVDLRKNYYDIDIINSLVIYLNAGFVNTINSKILKLEQIGNTESIKNKFAKELKKKINLKKNYLEKELELFNLRNDKNLILSKIINFLKIKNYLSKNQSFKVHLISDDHLTTEVIKLILKKKIINEFNYNVEKKLTKTKNFFLYFFKFIFKVFIFLIISKISNQKKLIKILQKKNQKWCLSLYPNFFSKDKEIFFGKNFSCINFLFSDETHLNHTLLKIIFSYFKLRKKKINIESFIDFKDLLMTIKKAFHFKKKYKKLLNDKFIVDGVDLTNFYKNAINESFINRSKLSIYDNAIYRIIETFKINKFHTYLFEYNFGFYLIRKFKEKNCKVLGYQHGIFDKNLMWLDIMIMNNDKIFFPNEIISNYYKSILAYKNLYKNNVNKYALINRKISKLAKLIKICYYFRVSMFE